MLASNRKFRQRTPSFWHAEIVKHRARLPKLAGRNCILATVAACFLAGAAWASPEAGIAMHGQPKYADALPHLNYVNPDAPKGGELRLGVLGSFDSLNPFIIKGAPGRRDARICLRHTHGAQLRRALLALRADCRKRGHAGGSQLGHVSNPPRSPLCRWNAGNAGRRAVLLVAPEKQRAAEPSHVLRQGCGSRKDRRARREIHLRGRRRPRDAPHHGAAAGAATSRGHAGKLRQNQLRQASCQRPLRSRGGFAGGQHRPEAQPRLLGTEPPGHARPVQFRHDPHRLLSRQHRHVGSLPQRAVRRDGRQRFHRRREMGGRLRFSGRAAGARQEIGIQRGRAGADGRAGLQHEAAQSSRTRGCARP